MFASHRITLPLMAVGTLAALLLVFLASAPAERGTMRALASLPMREMGGPRPAVSAARALTETGAIQGLVWDDQDGDGVMDEGEPPLAGAVLTLEEVQGPLVLTRTTGADGYYLFGDLLPAYYDLTETDPPGYISTTPNQYTVRVEAGVTRTINFGDRLPPTATPTPAWGPMQPIVISCGTTYGGDTRQGIAYIERYNCRPAWQESGPEQVYLLELSQPQEVTAVLSLAPGIDLDIFLLQGPDPDRCLAGGDLFVRYDVPATGQYYLVVDGYLGDAGPYVLQVSCPLDPQATATPTVTPTPTPTNTPTPTITPTPTVTPTPTPTANPFIWSQRLPLTMRAYPTATPPLTTVILQQGLEGYLGVEDTYLNAYPEGRNANYSDDEFLSVRSNDFMAPLLRFDLSLLPPGAQIAQATLELYVIDRSNPNPVTVGVYNVERSWSITGTTWLQAAEGVPWEEPGCNGATDRYLSPEDQQTLSETGVWYGWEVTWLAQRWASDPAFNHGVILKGAPGGSVQYIFPSSEHGQRDRRPRLKVRYWVFP